MSTRPHVLARGYTLKVLWVPDRIAGLLSLSVTPQGGMHTLKKKIK